MLVDRIECRDDTLWSDQIGHSNSRHHYSTSIRRSLHLRMLKCAMSCIALGCRSDDAFDFDNFQSSFYGGIRHSASGTEPRASGKLGLADLEDSQSPKLAQPCLPRDRVAGAESDQRGADRRQDGNLPLRDVRSARIDEGHRLDLGGGFVSVF